MTDLLSLDLHDRNIDFWFYDKLFSADQLKFIENIEDEVLLEREFTEAPNFSLREIDYFSDVTKFYLDRTIMSDYIYLCNFYQGNNNYNHDVKLINSHKKNMIYIDVIKDIINDLLKVRYSEFMQHDKKEWYSFLNKKLDKMLYLSVISVKSSCKFYFKIGIIKINSPNT